MSRLIMLIIVFMGSFATAKYFQTSAYPLWQGTQSVSQSEHIQAAVRLNAPAASCGTIINVVPDDYNPKHCVAYILSTGHMSKRTEIKVEVFYVAGQKLKTPLIGMGELLFIVDNHEKGVDFSLVKVSLKCSAKDLHCVPLAENIEFGIASRSFGCDDGIVPKEFTATPTEWKTAHNDLWLQQPEASHAGRSGGGIIQNNRLVAVYWGSHLTQNKDKDGCATSINKIRSLLKEADLLDCLTIQERK